MVDGKLRNEGMSKRMFVKIVLKKVMCVNKETNTPKPVGAVEICTENESLS